jgi:RHS repeat-associated protein
MSRLTNQNSLTASFLFRSAQLVSSKLSLMLLVVAVLSATAFTQEKNPQRGFQPGNSYNLSDIETINTTNGNLILNFPLSSMPAGRGSLPGVISLRYNSKLYDSIVEQTNDDSGQLASQNFLSQSLRGGWSITTSHSYSLNIENRSQVQGGQFPCVPGGGTENNKADYIWKVKIQYPDGAEREFRPAGHHDVLRDGYFNVNPSTGEITGGCGQTTSTAPNPLTYFSTDGTYTRLVITRGVGWVLSFPDGTRVIANNNGTGGVFDRNGHSFSGGNVTLPNGHVVPAAFKDEFGRYVASEVCGDEVCFYSGGFNQVLVWKVKWKWIYVRKPYRTTGAAGGRERGGSSNQLWEGEVQVVERITLPSQLGNLSYSFTYNAPDYDGTNPPTTDSVGWGEVSRITLPSGAKAEYEYTRDGAPVVQPTTKRVLDNAVKRKKLVYDTKFDGVTETREELWSYGISNAGATVTGPDGSVTTQSFNDIAVANASAGLVYKEIYPDGTEVERLWQSNNPSTTTGFTGANGANFYVKKEFRSLAHFATNGTRTLSKTAIKDFEYDKNGNVTKVSEYDWVPYGDVQRDAAGKPTGVVTNPGAPLKVTLMSYYNASPAATDTTTESNNAYWNRNAPTLRNAIRSVEIQNGSGQPLSRTEFDYDNENTTGNVIQQLSWDSTKGAYTPQLTLSNSLATATQYEPWVSGGPSGKLISTTDAKGVQTRFTYGVVGSASNLYVTEIETAYGTPVERTGSREYDLTSGLVTKTTDVDNRVSTKITYDAIGRPTLVQAAFETAEETRTATEYFDEERKVVTRSDLKVIGDGKLVTINHYDPLGRVRLTRQLEDSSVSQAENLETIGIKVQIRYLSTAGNNYVLTSSPYRAATSGQAALEGMGWSLTTESLGGRLVTVQSFGGSALPAPWGNNAASTGTITTIADEEFSTVTDQAGKVRRSVINGLGRMIRVDEPTTNGLGSANAPNQPTHYEYDARGNLTKVLQPTNISPPQQSPRVFEYDSLSRLSSAENPESGRVTYKYDDNGNLKQRTDARNISLSYEYDELNRNTSVDYSNTIINNQGEPGFSQISNIPDILRVYDGATNGKGRLWYSLAGGNDSFGNRVEKTLIHSYDSLGRPKVLRQSFKSGFSWSQPYETSRNYNLAGGVTSQTYPSGRSVTYNYDNSGRLADDGQNLAFTGNLGDGVPRTYSQGLEYRAAGQLMQERFGTNTAVYNKRLYNSRGQLAEILVSTSGNNLTWDRGKILNQYSLQCSGAGCNANDNNGNLRKQDIFIPAVTTISWYQQYDYDELNRLKRVHEFTGDSTKDWQQEFAYDRWGNRIINAVGTFSPIASPNTIPEPGYSVDPAHNNRLTAPAGFNLTYDISGNVITDTFTGTGSRVYDAENRMIEARGGLSQYRYNANGQRVRRYEAPTETWQVYGFEGELLAEYPAGGAAANPQKEYGYRNGELLLTAEPTAAQENQQQPAMNVALQSNGATATASSELDSGRTALAAINGDRKGQHWGTDPATGSGWHCATQSVYPDTLEIRFNGTRTIAEVDIFAVQDNWTNPVEPTESMTASVVGVTAFMVEYWNGSTWATIPDTNVTGNTKVWRKFTFSPINTSKIKVTVTGAQNYYSRLAEVEAWTPGPAANPRLNVALEANGSSATCSTYQSSGTAPRSAINGDRKGLHWGSEPATGSGWHDATNGAWPDWIQVNFASAKVIDELNVVSVQDDPGNPVEPTLSTTFTQYGASAFKAYYWSQGSWVLIPGIDVTGNNKVWRKFTFSPITTTKIKLEVSASPNQTSAHSRVVELEAFGTNQTDEAATASSSNVHWLVTDQLGTPRMIIDQTGSLSGVTRRDYLPFGEEVPTNVGRRSEVAGYSTTNDVRQKFTQKERDNETGLDFFEARYYANVQGRFTSTDPVYIEMGRLSDPQQLNLYPYTRNNPLKFVDPSGLDIEVTGTEQEAYRKRLQQDVSFTVQLNSKTNKVEIVGANGNVLDKNALKALGKTLKGGEKELFNAITDTKNHVTVDTVRKDSGVFFGRFDGGGKNTIDFGDVDLLDNTKNAGGLSAGQVVGHETLEAYSASKGKGLIDAHAFANQFFGGLGAPIPPGTPVFDATNTHLTGVIVDFPVVSKPGVTARVTQQFVTPIPVAAIPTTQAGSQAVHVVNVEKKP